MSYFHSSSHRWQKLRDTIQKKYHHICQNPFHCHDGVIVPSDVVHHIIPVEEDESLSLSKDNLIPLCNECHIEAHRLILKCRNKYDYLINMYKYHSHSADSKSLIDKEKTSVVSQSTEISNKNGYRINENECFETKKGHFCVKTGKYRKFPCAFCKNLKKK